MSAREALIVVLAALGALFLLASAIGVLRLPGVHARMHAVGKASTLGISCLLLSGGIYFGREQIWLMIALILLFFITAPIATTAIARAAFRVDPRQRMHLVYSDLDDARYRQGEALTPEES